MLLELVSRVDVVEVVATMCWRRCDEANHVGEEGVIIALLI